MSIHEYECDEKSALLTLVRMSDPEPEIEFDDYIAKFRIGLAPKDEVSGAAVGISIYTCDGMRNVLIILKPIHAAKLSRMIALAASEEVAVDEF